MDINNSLIASDFNNDYLLSHLKTHKKLKNKHKFYSKHFENFLLDYRELKQIKNFDNIYIITQLNKMFDLEDILTQNEKKKRNRIKKIILEIENSILNLSSKFKKVTFFLWPYDLNDNYLNGLNFKNSGKNWIINFINLEISNKLSKFQNVFLTDPNYRLLKKKNPISIFDEKTKYLVGNCYSLDFMEFCAKEIIESLIIDDIKKIKLIILDLDNTLWGGEAGERNSKDLELGPNSIKGMVFQNFQKRLKNLKNLGYLLAICSKNDLTNVKKAFKFNKNMTLNFKDFSSIKVNWKNKNENIREILLELNLRAENTLFVDDNEYERNIVKSDIKEINIFEFPKNVLLLNETFNKLNCISKNNISETDKQRTKLYLDEKKRVKLKSKYFNHKDWLSSLNIKINIDELKNFQRAAEMYLRTNQFNISHKPVSSEKIKSLVKKNEKIFYEVSMADRFGNYGVIAIIGIKENAKTFEITDFLESCRVFKRNIEDYLIRFVNNRARFKNKEGIIHINRNKKNIYVQNLFDNCKYLRKVNNKTYKILKSYKFPELRNIGVKVIT